MYILKRASLISGVLGAGLAYSWKMKCDTKKDEKSSEIINFDLFNDFLANDLSKVRIFSMNENRDLANEIAFHLNTRLNRIKIENLYDHTEIELLDSVRSKHVYIICNLSQEKSLNDTFVELMLTVSAAKRASASKVNVILPYMFYSRQIGMFGTNRPSLFLADVMQMLGAVGCDKIITANLRYSEYCKGFFNNPVVEIDPHRVCVKYFKDVVAKDVVIVCLNDRVLLNALKIKEGLEDKMNTTLDLGVIGGVYDQGLSYIGNSIKGREVLLIDDMIDTGVTLGVAAEYLNSIGASKIYAYATHGLFSDKATKIIKHSPIKEVVVTNTIPRDNRKDTYKIKYLSIAKMFAETIAQSSFNKTIDQLKSEKII